MRKKEFERQLGVIFSLPPAKLERALKQLIREKQAAKEYPFAHEASFHLAAYYYENEKLTRAKGILLPIVANYVKYPFIPRYVNMFMLLGVIELGEEDFTLADYYFRTGLRLAKLHRLPRAICLGYSNLAIVNSALGRNEAALKHLLMAQKYLSYAAEEQHVLVYLNLAVCYKYLGRLAESQEALRCCIEEHHGLESGRRALIQCCQMDLYYKQGRMDDYERVKRQIIAESGEKPTPDRMQAYQMICERAFDQQDLPLAELMLTRLRALLEGQDDKATRFFIAACEGRMAKLAGDKDRCIEALEEQLRLKNEITLMTSQRLIKSTGIEIRLSQLMRKNEDAKRAQEEERKRGQVLSEALDMAREANAAKSEFLSRMSHDIRTPMNAILGFAELGRQDVDNKELLLCDLDRISSAGEFLLGLVNDVLDMTKIESHAMELKPQPYPLTEFRRQLDTLVGSLCANKHIDFSFAIAQGIPDCIEVDRLRFNQVFFNRLSNAIKFTPDYGRIALRVDPLHEPSAPHGRHSGGKQTAWLRFTVSDNGIGMSEAFQARMFEAFSQEQQHITGREGTGLGLAIVKSIVGMMEGTIAVRSDLNEGTTFTVDLPCRLAALPVQQAQREQPPAPEMALRGRRVLLCEDHPINRQLAKRLLEKVGVTVICAENGREGVDMFSASPERSFDAVLMDIRMPVMDGIEATSTIRALPRPDAKTVPIVAMTANAFDADVQHCLTAGMTGHLAKPFQVQQLYGMLAEQLQGKLGIAR